MAAIAVHVVDDNIVTAGYGNAIILVDDYAVANLGIVGGGKIEPIAVVGSGKAIRAIIRRVAGTVVQRDVVDIEPSAVADAEAMNRVVLDVNIVN